MPPLETSTLSSLRELMRFEEERVRLEAQEAEERLLDAELAEQREREAEEAAWLELERAREERARRDREEEARLERLREAELERARAEIEERTRFEERAHARQLAELANDTAQAKLRRQVRWVAAGGLAWLVASACLYFGRIRPGMAERARGLQAIIDARHMESEQLRSELVRRDQRVLELENRVRDEAEKEAVVANELLLVKEAQDLKRRAHAKKKARADRAARSNQAGRRAKDAAACTCDPHDPMCGCFERP
jgi:hypothetical protein